MSAITIYKGLATTLTQTYKDSSGAAQSITGFTITGSVRKNRGDSSAIFSLTTAGESANIVISELGETSVGVFVTTISAANSALLTEGSYILGYAYKASGETDYHFFGEVALNVITPINSGA